MPRERVGGIVREPLHPGFDADRRRRWQLDSEVLTVDGCDPVPGAVTFLVAHQVAGLEVDQVASCLQGSTGNT